MKKKLNQITISTITCLKTEMAFHFFLNSVIEDLEFYMSFAGLVRYVSVKYLKRHFQIPCRCHLLQS